MAVTTPGAYLIIARYNREKWNGLKKPAPAAETRAHEVGADGNQNPTPEAPEGPTINEQQEAHEQAEKLFPENNFPLPQLTDKERRKVPPLVSTESTSPPDLKGVRMLHTFHTNMFARLHEKIPDIDEGDEDEDAAASTPAEDEPMPEQTRSQILDEIFTAPNTGEKDPGIGWLAIVDAGDFKAFVENAGGKTHPLWRMYDIEVVPLNNDQTTWDIYKMMTPVHWN